MMKLSIFFLCIFLNISFVIAQNDTIYLKQVEITDTKHSYNIFSKKIQPQKLKYDNQQAFFNIKMDNENYQGEIFLKNLNVDSLSLKNEKIKNINTQILKVAYTSWYLIYKKKIKDFICQQIGDYDWKFISFKNNKKIELDEFDNFEMITSLSKNGKLLQNILFFFPKEGKKYKIYVLFSNFNNKLEFKTIKGEFIDDNILFEIIF